MGKCAKAHRKGMIRGKPVKAEGPRDKIRGKFARAQTQTDRIRGKNFKGRPEGQDQG